MKSALGLTTEELDRSDNNNNNYDNKDINWHRHHHHLHYLTKVSSPHKSPGYLNNNKSEEEEEDDSSEEMDKTNGRTASVNVTMK